MSNPGPHKINVTVYVTVSILAVVAVFGFKFYNLGTHDASRRVREEIGLQDAGMTIEDLNDTLSAPQDTWLKTMIRAQMRFHAQHTPWTEPLAVKVSLWEFDADFRDYQRRISKRSTSSKGVYSVSRRERFRPPKWLSEGLSEYFEEMTQNSSGEWVVQEQPASSQRLEQWLAAGELPPLPQFLNRSSAEWRAQNKKVPYLNQTLSWGLVYFLMQTPQGRNALLNTIRDLKDKPYDGDSARVLNDHYALGQLEQDFYRFIPEITSQQKYLQE